MIPRALRRAAAGLAVGVLTLAPLAAGSDAKPDAAETRLAGDAGLEVRAGVLLAEGRPFTGMLVERYESGAPKRTTAYRDGLRHGASEAWYEGGERWQHREYSDGLESGTHLGWWPNGARRFEYTFEDGVYEGTAREWFEDGLPYRESRYEAGHEAGLQRMWYADGSLRASYVVRDGRRYGFIGSKGCGSPEEAS